MTDQNEAPVILTDEEKADRDHWVINENRKRDLDLHALMEVVLGFNDEYEKNSFNVTLVCSGLMICGRAVTRSAWSKASNFKHRR